MPAVAMWRLFALVAAVCIALLLWPEAVEVLRWQRGAVGAREPWRLLSAHFAHLGPWHALSNLAGMALLIELLGASIRPAEAVQIGMASALAIVAGLAMFHPTVGWYAGLSGVVHGGWAGFALLGGWRQQRTRCAQDLLPLAALAVLVLKLLWMPAFWPALQLCFPARWMPTMGGALPVVPQSHVYGAIGGAVAALALIARLSSKPHVRQCNTELD